MERDRGCARWIIEEVLIIYQKKAVRVTGRFDSDDGCLLEINNLSRKLRWQGGFLCRVARSVVVSRCKCSCCRLCCVLLPIVVNRELFPNNGEGLCISFRLLNPCSCWFGFFVVQCCSVEDYATFSFLLHNSCWLFHCCLLRLNRREWQTKFYNPCNEIYIVNSPEPI